VFTAVSVSGFAIMLPDIRRDYQKKKSAPRSRRAR
jgi:hypothetical protein